VGRNPKRPGLVVTLLNIHKPRDRSHYERFAAYHESFYRSIEATSVTPFSPRALDRGLAGALVALARLGHAPMTPALGAGQILHERAALDFAVEVLGDRAHAHAQLPSQKDRPLPDIFYDPRSLALPADKRASLHAKCVVVDRREVFVSSANFTEAAHERNIEVGLLIHSRTLAERIVRHFEALLAEGLLKPVWDSRDQGFRS